MRTVVFEAAWKGLRLPALVLLVHLIASRGFDAYGRWPLLDMPMHLAGGASIAYGATTALRVLVQRGALAPLGRPLETVLVFALAATAAVTWEFAEWISDRFLHTHAQIGLEDTLLDMAIGIVGGALYLARRAALGCRSK